MVPRHNSTKIILSKYTFQRLVYNSNIILTMKFLVAASLIAGAAAFAPASRTATSSSTSLSAFTNELGVQEPLGYWDPLGLVADGNKEKFERLRYVEVKHGRICMLAVVGYLVTEFGGRLPGNISFDGTTFASIPSGFAALSAMPSAGLVQILAFVGFLEILGWKQAPGSFPGDFSASSFPVGFLSSVKTEEQKLDYRAKELNQGRAAQMGILALMVHEQLGVDILPPH